MPRGGDSMVMWLRKGENAVAVAFVSGGTWGALHVPAGLTQSLARPGSPRAVCETGRRGLGYEQGVWGAIWGRPGKEWGSEAGKGRSHRGARSRAGDCGGRSGLGPLGDLWETAESVLSEMPNPRDRELQLLLAIGHQLGVAATLWHFQPELGCQPRGTARAQGSQRAATGTGRRACGAALTHLAALSFMWSSKFIQTKFLRYSASHSHGPRFECSTGPGG